MGGARIDDLHRLARAALDAELARLRDARARCEAGAARIDALDGAVARQHAVIAAEMEAPVAGPVLDLWGGWADRRRAALNTALARDMATLEERRAQALAAFGRTEALRLMSQRRVAEARRVARRRATRGL